MYDPNQKQDQQGSAVEPESVQQEPTGDRSSEDLTLMQNDLPTHDGAEGTATAHGKTGLLQPVTTRVTEMLGIDYPIICGAMYPCSNPELVMAVSKAGAIGVAQPLSFEFVHGWDVREAFRWIRDTSGKPFGVNIMVRSLKPSHHERMMRYTRVALEEGCTFFVTSLGDPRWVVDAVRQYEGVRIFHKVINLRHAQKALEAGVDGIILVNDRAGGHLGTKDAAELLQEFRAAYPDRDIPVVLAGGVGCEEEFRQGLELGYDAILMGTRFIATKECNTPDEYKHALEQASEHDVVLTKAVDGEDLAVLNTDIVKQRGLKQPLLVRIMRACVAIAPKPLKPFFYNLAKNAALNHIQTGFEELAEGAKRGDSTKDYYQAGRSVGSFDTIESVDQIIGRFISDYHGNKSS